MQTVSSTGFLRTNLYYIRRKNSCALVCSEGARFGAGYSCAHACTFVHHNFVGDSPVWERVSWPWTWKNIIPLLFWARVEIPPKKHGFQSSFMDYSSSLLAWQPYFEYYVANVARGLYPFSWHTVEIHRAEELIWHHHCESMKQEYNYSATL